MSVRLTTAQFIIKANNIHNNLYTYDNTQYTTAHTKLSITCRKHGDFLQSPVSHITSKQGCPHCGGTAKNTTLGFISKANIIHHNKYDYSNVVYKSNDYKISINCKIHGIFEQTPRNHLVRKAGCPHCAGLAKLTTQQFIERAIKIHNNLYNYDKVEYINQKTKITITCNIHGDFSQTPTAHTHSKNGCPKCNYSKGEMLVEHFLLTHDIKFIPQYSPIDLVTQYKRARYRFDFFLPDHNILIEFDGIQHDKPIKRWNGFYTSFDNIQRRDGIKNKYAKDRSILLIRIKYKDINNINSILTGLL
jgi:Zn finger protein HypA/HybF involved in hydrogenase expression